MKKPSLAALLALCLGLLAGCAGGGAGPSSSGGSGVTVFGTIDAGVTHSRNQSR